MGGGGEGFKDEKSRLVDELFRNYGSFRGKLLEERDETKRYMLFIGFLNEWFQNRELGYIVVTGGFAVELLTGRAYRTMDVDVITSNPFVADVLEGFLSRISERIARGYLPLDEVLAVKSIDIVATAYTRRRKPVTIIIDEYRVYIDPPEELIVSYLASWKHRGSTVDRDKALWLLITLNERLDHEYLRERARMENVIDKLDALYKALQST